jgi:HK97 family phage major capsid protein
MPTPTIDEVVRMVDETKAENEQLKSQLKSLQSTPNFSGVRRDDEGRTTGEWEETDESVTIVSGYQGQGQVAKRPKFAMKSLIKQGYKPWGEFKSMGDFVRSGFEGHQTTAFKDRMVSHYKAVQGMSEAIGADGGFSVMPEFNTKIFSRIYGNDLFSATDNYTVAGNNMTFLANAETSRVNGSRHGGLRGYWTGEGNAITASKPTIREIQLKLQKLAVVVYLTDELIADSGQALEQYVTNKASDEFNFMIGDALFNGDGVGKPLGILNSPSLIAITKEPGQGPATLDTFNITKASGRFFAGYRPRAKWYVNQDTLPQMRTMTLGIGAAGIATYMPPGGLSTASYGTLDGSEIKPIEFAASIGNQGDVTLADLGQVLSISKGGVAQAVSMHVEFLTDQLALRFTMRMNACPWENSPITPFKGSNTQSSFVTLGAR